MARRKTIKAVIIENDTAFINKLVKAIEEEGIGVLRVCSDVEAAKEYLTTLKSQPDVLLISLEMLREAAAIFLDYIRGLRSKFFSAKLIVIGDRCTEEGRLSLSREGVHGFIQRSEPIPKIIKCISVVAAGEIWMDAAIVSRVFEECSRYHKESDDVISPANPSHYRKLEKLTSREKEILELLSMSLTNEEIARGLYISSDTVKTHVRNIFEKLEVKNRVEAVLIYIGSTRLHKHMTGN